MFAVLPQAAEIQLADERVVVPMSHANRNVAVTVVIDGRPYAFQVDTYASIDACIDDDLAAALGLEKLRTTTNSDGRSKRTRDIVNIPKLQLGGVAWTDMQALVDDYDWLKTASGGRVHGLLGFPAFRDVLLTFDYPADQLVFERGTLSANAPFSMPFEGSGRAPDIWLELDDRRLQFGIDTGHSGSLSLQLSDADELSLMEDPVVIGRARTVYSDFEILGAYLADAVDLAGHPLRSPHVAFSKGAARRLLGYDALRPFAVTFDQRTGRVRFLRPSLPEGIELADEALSRWVGRYRARGTTVSIERDGAELFLRKPGGPRRALMALSEDELLMRSHPLRLRRGVDSRGRATLRITEHAERPVVEAVRVDAR
jgi:hypothetical protein